MATTKKQEAKTTEAAPEIKTEPVVVSDIITETIEIVEEVAPETKKESQEISENPLNDFKERMVAEEYSTDDTPKKNYMWPILFIFIVAALLLGGVFLYKRGISVSLPTITKVSVTPTATPTPTVVVDLTKYEIEILNGGGVDGEASRQRTILEAAGFVISSVGNADNSDFTDTIIQAKATVDKAFVARLTSELNTTFTVGTAEVLPETSSVPVIVTLGVKK